MQYRRSRAKGATFFFTVVTHNRRRILCLEPNVALIKEAFRGIIEKHPFTVDAFVLLPDHLHCIWTLPEEDNDFSMRWRQIKAYFTKACCDKFKEKQTAIQQERGEQTVWQRRYWEHQIRDDDDFIKHVEYIHYNPVKHGLVKAPIAWRHSTFRRYVKQGIYHRDWGAGEKMEFSP
jgi:putative transposase